MALAVLGVRSLVALLILVAHPIGRYVARVCDGEPVYGDRVLTPVERWMHPFAGVDPRAEMTWTHHFQAIRFQLPMARGGTGRPQRYVADHPGGSHKGPSRAAPRGAVAANLQAFLAANPSVRAAQVPLDPIEISGSDLDRDIAHNAATTQIPRGARATGIPAVRLDRLVGTETHAGPLVRRFGSRYANVLGLNLKLAALESAP